MSHKVIVTAFCRNRYDHTESIQHDMCTDYTGSATDPDNISVYESYMSWATSRANMKETGWISVVEVDMITGLSTVLYHHTNPLLERVELNKVAKVKKVKTTGADWNNIMPVTASFPNQSLSEYINQLSAQAIGQGLTPEAQSAIQFTEDEPLQF